MSSKGNSKTVQFKPSNYKPMKSNPVKLQISPIHTKMIKRKKAA